MPTAIQVTSENTKTHAAGSTTAEPLAGGFFGSAAGLPEADAQCRIRSTLTLGNLLVRVTVNGAAANSTVRTRVGGVNGNCSVTIGAGLIGEFEDTVNTDSLVSGNLANYQIVVGAGGALTITIISSTLVHATNTTFILASTTENGFGPGLTRYRLISGKGSELTANQPYTVRTAYTVSRLNVYVFANGFNSASTVRTYVNGANGAQSVSIPAWGVGEFEDAANSDALTAGDTIGIQMVSGGAANSITIAKAQTQWVCATNSFALVSGTVWVLGNGLTRYRHISGRDLGVAAPESQVQMKVRGTAFTARNLMVRVAANTLDGATTVTFRIGAADGTLTLSIGAAATGDFEDTANTDSVALADEIDYEIVTAGTGGQITLSLVGIQSDPPPSGHRGLNPALAIPIIS